MKSETANRFRNAIVERSKSMRVLMDSERRQPLFTNSVYMMGTTVVTAGIGYIFWVFATHAYPAHDVGLASALIAAMTLVSILSNPGIHSTFVQLLPHREAGNSWSLTVNAGLACGVVTGLFAGCILVAVLPFISSEFAVVVHQPLYAVGLIVGVPLTTLSILIDYIFVAERFASGMLWRNTLFAAFKVPLLALPALLGAANALGIFSSWIAASAISIMMTALILIPKLRRGYYLAIRGLLGQIRSMLPSFGWQHFINLGATAPIYLLPVIVTVRLSATYDAYFYTTWMIGSLFYMVGPAVATSLFVEGSHRVDEVGAKVRSCCLITAAFLAPAVLVCLLGRRFILSLFGPAYVAHGTLLLTILIASAAPDAITNIYVAVLRVQGRLGTAALLNLGIAIVTLAVAWALLPRWGIAGAGWASLIALTGGSLLAVIHTSMAAVHKRAGSRAIHRQRMVEPTHFHFT